MQEIEEKKEKLSSPFDSWSLKDGDYSREGYSYDKSHEDLVKDDKKKVLLWNGIYLTIGFAIIILIIHFLSTT